MSFFTISRLLELNIVVDQKDVRHNPRKKKPSRKPSSSSALSDAASMGSGHSLSTMTRIFRRKSSKPDSVECALPISEAEGLVTDPFTNHLSKLSSSTSPPPSDSLVYSHNDDHLLTPSSIKNFAFLSGDCPGLMVSRRSSLTSAASPRIAMTPRQGDQGLHPPIPNHHHLHQNYSLSQNQLHPAMAPNPSPTPGLAPGIDPMKRGSIEPINNNFDPTVPLTIPQTRSNSFSLIPHTVRRHSSQQSFASSHSSSQHSGQRSSRSSRRPSAPTIQTKSAVASNAPPLPSLSLSHPQNGPASASASVPKPSSILLSLQLPPFQINPLEQISTKDHIKFKDGYTLEQKKMRNDDAKDPPKPLNKQDQSNSERDIGQNHNTKHPDQDHTITADHASLLNPFHQSVSPADFKLLHETILPSANSQGPVTSLGANPPPTPSPTPSPTPTSPPTPPISNQSATSNHVFGSCARNPHPRLGARQSNPPPPPPKTNLSASSTDQTPWVVAGKVVPRFIPHLSKRFLNYTKLSPSMASPEAQIQRFNTFMDSLLGLQWNDPVTFANIRLLSLMKFTMRHKDAKALGENPSNRNQFYYEGILSYEIINMRIFMRDMMMHASRNLTRRSSIAEDRELMQLNFVNYLAYLLQLPGELDPAQQYDEWLVKHYQHRNIFLKIADNLCTLDLCITTNNEGQNQNQNQNLSQSQSQQSSNSSMLASHQQPQQPSHQPWFQDKAHAEAEEQNAANASVSRIGPLLKAISKVAYEYNLLETYQIQIFAKLNRNLLFESGLLHALFDTHKQLMDQELTVLPKVLVFNITHSLQYIWYMCLTTPFVRVIELSILNENEPLANDYNAYRVQELVTPKHDFSACDRDLYESLFLKLYLGSFDEYSDLPASKLVLLHRHLDNKLAKYSNANFHEVSCPSQTFSHKPMNASFFDKPLLAIATNAFDAIQTRDLMFQLTRSNYKTIIAEFYRILKPGGVLEAPLMQAGIDKLKKNIEKELVANRVYQSRNNITRNQWHGADLKKVLQHFDLISNFPETFLKELHSVFGPANVRYNIVLLNSCNDVNDFLFKLNTLNVSAMLGHFDDYCNELKAEMSSDLRRSMPETGLQYYVHIRAQKPLE